MKYYRCLEPDCEKVFFAQRAASCPCCGGRMLRHALGWEIDRYESERKTDARVIPMFALGA